MKKKLESQKNPPKRKKESEKERVKEGNLETPNVLPKEKRLFERMSDLS